MDHSVTALGATLPEPQLVAGLGTLPDGRWVLFPTNGVSPTIQLFDPTTLMIAPGGDKPAALTSYGIALMPSGILYLFGGRRDGVGHSDVHRLDPLTGALTVLPGVLPQALAAIRPTVLQDGRVLLFGGQTDQGFIVGDTLLFTP
jgi:hypothetical protein